MEARRHARRSTGGGLLLIAVAVILGATPAAAAGSQRLPAEASTGSADSQAATGRIETPVFEAAIPIGQQSVIAAVTIESPLAELRTEAAAGVTVRVGSTYSIEQTRQSLQNIYALGSVSDVQVRAETGPDGLELTFVVLPAPRVSTISFSGRTAIETSILRDALRIRAGDRLTQEVARQQAERVQLAMSDRGYLLARVEPEVQLARSGAAATIVFHLLPGEATRLRRLVIDGDLGVSLPEVEAQLGLAEAGVFQPLTLADGIEKLRRYLAERNYFHAEVEITSQAINATANTVDIEIRVDAGPRVVLEIDGLDRSQQEQRELLPFWEETSVADWVLKAARRQMIEDLQLRGFWRPLVVYNRERDETGRNVVVRFTIRRGEKASVARIEFEGNDSLPDPELERSVETRPGGIFSPTRFTNRRWERDQSAIIGAYRSRGFEAAEIEDARVVLDRQLGGLRATMQIREGPQTVVNTVDLTLATPVDSTAVDLGAWRQQLRVREGDPYDPDAVREDEGRLRVLLANAGYARALVLSRTEVDEQSRSAAVDFLIQPGERVRVGRILIAGNEATDDEVILRELALVPGSPYTHEGVVESQSRLYRLGLFNRVDISPAEPDSIASERNLVVRVEEGARNRLSWGLGYDSEEGPRGLVTLANNNLRGKNRTGSLSSRSSFREQRVRLAFTEPYFLGRPLSSTTIAFFESVREEGFSVQRLGASYQLTKRHSESLSSLARYTFRRVRTFDLEIDPSELDIEDRAVIIGAVSYSLIRDSRPNPIDPRAGTYHTFEVEIASELLGSESDFIRFFGRSQWYRSFGQTVLAAAARAGLALPFAGDDDLPLPERFFTGGSSTLRGFGLNLAGPLDENGNPLGGEVLLLGNLEWRFPVRGNFGGVAFVDVGNVFGNLDTVSFRDIREVAGLGARYATPVGPVRLDWGKLLDKRAGEDGSRLYISVGHTF